MGFVVEGGTVSGLLWGGPRKVLGWLREATEQVFFELGGEAAGALASLMVTALSTPRAAKAAIDASAQEAGTDLDR